MTITPYALPAIFALLAKAGLFFYARKSGIHNIQTRLYLFFLFSLSIQNIAEITFFTAKAEGLSQPVGGFVYFGASIIAIASLLHLSLILATRRRNADDNLLPSVLACLYAPAIVLEVLLWFTPLLVAGFVPFSYTYTKVPGPLYFLFELYTVGYLCAVVALLLYGAVKQPAPLRRSQNKILLTGLFPIVALVITIVALQRIGFSGFNSTATLPLAVTFFLAVTAYATHQHRLFDIEFFIPWSRLHKRKTAFYKRIQALIAEISNMNSVHKVVKSLSEALRCPVVFIGGPKPALAIAGEALGVARFPVDELRKVDHIVVANEIADAMPGVHTLMKRHRVAAIVPFHPHSQAAASWMLLGETFSEHVYSPLDFKVVEALFARLADHFLDNQLLLRSQLAEAKREMEALHHRLANAWGQLEAMRKELKALARENRLLERKNAELLHGNVDPLIADQYSSALNKQKSLDEHIAEFEARLIAIVLEHCDDDVTRAAEFLETPVVTLYRKIRDYQLVRREKTT